MVPKVWFNWELVRNADSDLPAQIYQIYLLKSSHCGA